MCFQIGCCAIESKAQDVVSSIVERTKQPMFWWAWAVYFSLGLCLVFSLFYLASYFGLTFYVLSNRGMLAQTVGGNIFSGFWDPLIWGIAVFVVLAWLLYDLKSKIVRGGYQPFGCWGFGFALGWG